jgi:hypothetical protein
MRCLRRVAALLLVLAVLVALTTGTRSAAPAGTRPVAASLTSVNTVTPPSIPWELIRFQ